MTKFSNTYDLEERTAKFAEEIVELVKVTLKNSITIPILDQLIRAGTSMGANYYEANNASSKKDFRNKIYICKKEANETKYWLRILAKAVPELKVKIRKLWIEAQELNLIFQRIATSLDKKKSKNN